MSKLDSVPPTDPVDLTNGLTLSPRMKLLLTINRADASVAPLDEWKLKRSLIDFLKTCLSHHPILLPEEDLHVRRFKDLKKRSRHDPVARCVLFIRDLGFVVSAAKLVKDPGNRKDEASKLEEKFVECRKGLVEKMDGMEVNLEGVRFRVSVSMPIEDDFEKMKKEAEEFFAFEAGASRGFSRHARQEPDTVILRGLPSRWFSEPRVSSKPSMLVTHTIFSMFGKIRNLNVAEDNDLGKDTDEDDGDIVSGLHCKVVVQFEKVGDFYNALKVLCSRSLQKEGSRMKADYEVTWDKDGFFQNGRRHAQERTSRISEAGGGRYRNEAPRRQRYDSRYSPDDNVQPKRFKE